MTRGSTEGHAGMRKMMAALAVVATIAAGCGGGEQTQAAPSPSPSAAQMVGVAALDFAFEGVPETLEAGETTFVLANEGDVSHEMTIALMPEGWTIEEVAFESSESGSKIVGVIDPIGPGESGEVTMDLEPGQYGYICHEIGGTKGKDKEHYYHGMIGEFTVE